MADDRIELARLRDCLRNCADELESEINARYGIPVHPAQKSRYERDLSTVVEARAILSAPATPSEGLVDEREAFWLVERNVSPPQYISDNSAGWHSDVWQATRFMSERDAHDYWRSMTEGDRRQFKVVEHLFINKSEALSTPATSRPARPPQVAELIAQAKEAAEFVENHLDIPIWLASTFDRLATALAAQGDGG